MKKAGIVWHGCILCLIGSQNKPIAKPVPGKRKQESQTREAANIAE